jgi:hypothetical protein
VTHRGLALHARLDKRHPPKRPAEKSNAAIDSAD